MKKICVGLLVATTGAIANATSFDGFYAGISAGYTQRKQILTMRVVGAMNGANSFDITNQQSKNMDAFNYGLMAGYGRVIGDHRIYAGWEVSLNYDTANKFKEYEIKTPVSSYGGPALVVRTQYNRGLALGLSPRFGIVFLDTYMAFIKPGLEISRDYAKFQLRYGDTSFITTPKKIRFTFAPGIGITRLIHNNLLLTASYDYCFGSKIKEMNIRYTSHVFKLGLAYKF